MDLFDLNLGVGIVENNMARPRSKKYPQKIRAVRGLAKIEIPKILKNRPQNSKFIISKFKEKQSGFCDDNFLCKCKNQSKMPEWKHQVKWAIQDLKYASIIKVDATTKFYSMIK